MTCEERFQSLSLFVKALKKQLDPKEEERKGKKEMWEKKGRRRRRRRIELG